jgi:SAM-dependent methyltransferase
VVNLNHYVLRGDEAGAERLRVLARVQWPTTRTLLRRVGLKRGARVLDVGCGIGEVTRALARLVGRGGLAVGVDGNAYFIDLARRERQRLGGKVVFHVGRAEALKEEAAYDLVYARFLLTHLPDPAAALRGMARAARPGGVVVVEDIDATGLFSYPDCPALSRCRELYEEAVRRHGGDAAIGPRLPGLLRGVGLKEVQLAVVQPAFEQGEGKRVPQVTMEHVRGAVVGAGVATDADLDAVVAELDRFASDPDTILSLPRIFQVWGRRPEAGSRGLAV